MDRFPSFAQDGGVRARAATGSAHGLFQGGVHHESELVFRFLRIHRLEQRLDRLYVLVTSESSVTPFHPAS